MKIQSRFFIGLLGAIFLHGVLGLVLLGSRHSNAGVALNEEPIEVVTEGPDGAPGKKELIHTPQSESVYTKSVLTSAESGSGPEKKAGAPISGAVLSSYLSTVRDHLSAAIRIPDDSFDVRKLVLKITLLENGDVKNPSIEQSSGSVEFDRSVLEAVDRAKPFPPFTKELSGTHELTLKIPVIERRR